MFEVLDALDGQGLADALDANARAILGRQAFELVAVAAWADVHNEDSVATDASGRVLAGMERAKGYGGDGTPLVAEFATAELGPLLARSVGSADALLRDALDLRHRHPRLWARVEDTAKLAASPAPALTGHPVVCVDPGTGAVVDLVAELGLEAVVPVPVWQARKVAQACHTAGLTLAQAHRVDELTTPLLGCLPWARFERLLAAAIIEVDPDAAQARADADALRQGVTVGPSTEQGLMTMFIKARSGDVIIGHAMVDRLAQLLALDGDTQPLGVRQARAATLLMGNPYQAVELLLKYATDTNDNSTGTGGDGDADTAGDPAADAAADGAEDSADGRPGTGVARRGRGRGGRRGEDLDGVGWILGDLGDLAVVVDLREPDYREVVLDPDDAPAPPPQTPPDDDFPRPDVPTALALPSPPDTGPTDTGGDDDPSREPVQDQTRPAPPRPDAGDPWSGLPPPGARDTVLTGDPALWEQEPDPDVLSTWDIHPCANDADDPQSPVEPCPTCHGTGRTPSDTGSGAATATGAGRSGVPADAAAARALLDAVRAGKIKPEKLFPTTALYVHLSAHGLWHALHPETRPGTGAGTGSGAGAGGNGQPCPYCAAGETVPAAVRVEGSIGPVLADQARDWLAHTRVTVKPVIDLNVNHAVDCYEVPAWMAEALHLAAPGCCFPHSPSTSRRVDHDHTIPYATNPDGTPVAPKQTRLGNLGKLQRRLHRVKTHKPGWRVHQPERGVYLWRSPHGHWYRVDNTGTHRLGKAPDLTGYHLPDQSEDGDGDRDHGDKPDSPA